MRVKALEVLASLNRGGAERIAVTLARGLDAARFEAGLVSLFNPGQAGLAAELEGTQVATWFLGKRKGLDPRMWLRLRRVFRQWRPHVIHTHSYVLRYVWPAAIAAGGPALVHTVHNEADKEVDALGRWFNRRAFQWGAVPVAVSKRIARSFEQVYRFKPVVIPNGIDLPRYQKAASERNAWRARHGFLAEDFLVACVGRLEEQKDPLGLIRAFHLGLGSDSRCHLLIAGAGSYEARARALAAELSLSNRVHFLGLQKDVAGLLGACDAFALASRWEGSPLAVMEAMAAGLPVAATAVGGVPELLQDGESGILAPPGDPAELGRALARLAKDPGLRRRMGAAAQERARRFSAEAMTEGYEKLFQKLARVPE
jgi:glycosyltransferase involved in cell wall biosynthesis